ncbi:MAG TPA: putative DNA binding domain-containing protein [Candidatus Kapabacteria bacterium]|nr:putative DNA binding domain-containing protein [Candidatus Kapabacteria bacterium]
MRAKELLSLISEGESSSLEFKRKTTAPSKIAKEIVAIANTKGGYLLVGIDDNGKIYGIASEKSEIDVISTCCQFYIEPPITPNIEIVCIDSKDILVLRIDNSNYKPHRVKHDGEKNESKENNKIYIRVGEKSVEASREMSRLMRSQTDDKPLKLGIGENEKRLFKFLEQNERATVKDFAKIVNISNRRAERLLIRLVRAGVLQIHNDSTYDYFTLV